MNILKKIILFFQKMKIDAYHIERDHFMGVSERRDIAGDFCNNCGKNIIDCDCNE